MIKKLRRVKALALKFNEPTEHADQLILPTENVIHLDDPGDLLTNLSESISLVAIKQKTAPQTLDTSGSMKTLNFEATRSTSPLFPPPAYINTMVKDITYK